MTIFSASLRGVDGFVHEVEAKPTQGDGFSLMGLSQVSARETRVRVRAALDLEHKMPAGVEVVLSRGKSLDGGGFDLPIALAIANFDKHFNEGAKIGAVGELGLDGSVRPVRGVLPVVQALAAAGVTVVYVAVENGAEAALVPGIHIRCIRSLRDAFEGHYNAPTPMSEPHTVVVSMNDVKGNDAAKQALRDGLAKKTPVLLIGPPGAGKTMLARRVPSLMDKMTREQALETTAVHSVAGLTCGGGIAHTRPFRAPHHTTTAAGLVGGGASTPRPGEVSLAENGVLFLDSVTEFSKQALEVLAHALREGEVVLTRASGTVRFPCANVQLVMSADPCACGHFPEKKCSCSAETINHYGKRLDAIVAMFSGNGLVAVAVEAADLSRM